MVSSAHRDLGLRTDPHGRASFPACPPADNVATYASPCDNSTAAWLLHPPTSVPLGNSSHHLHSLAPTPLRDDVRTRLIFQPHFLGVLVAVTTGPPVRSGAVRTSRADFSGKETKPRASKGGREGCHARRFWPHQGLDGAGTAGRIFLAATMPRPSRTE